MNYTWDYLIKSLHKGFKTTDINLYKAEECSPYMELSFHDINFSDVDIDTQVNVYYRDTYTKIFKYIFDPDLNDGKYVTKQLCDILLHTLFETDRYQGMSRREYYIRFIVEELREGVCGEKVSKQIDSFEFHERIIIANGLLSLYRTGENMFVLRRVLKNIFKHSILYSNTRESNYLFFYLRTKRTQANQDKIDCIVTLFMPIRFKYEIYWEKIFGIQAMDAYMSIEDILQF